MAWMSLFSECHDWFPVKISAGHFAFDRISRSRYSSAARGGPAADGYGWRVGEFAGQCKDAV